MKRPPRVFFAFRSPFSWLALERLRRAVPDAQERLEFIPFWEPDRRTAAGLAARGASMHYVAMSKAKHLYILHDTKRLAEQAGMKMAWPIDDDPCWELPHLGWLLARRLGAGVAFYDAVIAARWQRGENICDPAVLRALADGIGLDDDAIAAAADDPELRAAGVECLVEAYRDDIFGVPYFRAGRHRFWGLDRLDAFLAALRSPALVANGHAGGAFEGVPAGLLARVGAYDTDAPGGCG